MRELRLYSQPLPSLAGRPEPRLLADRRRHQILQECEPDCELRVRGVYVVRAPYENLMPDKLSWS